MIHECIDFINGTQLQQGCYGEFEADEFQECLGIAETIRANPFVFSEWLNQWKWKGETTCINI